MAYDGYFLTYKKDRETNERFDEIQSQYPNFRMVKINLEDFTDPKLDKAIKKIASVSNTKHFWIVDPDVKVDPAFDFGYETEEWDSNITHVWNAEERNVFRTVVGIKLFRTKDILEKEVDFIKDAYYLTGEYKEHKTDYVEYKPTKETYEIFYWNKGYGKENLAKLKERFPAIQQVTGMTNLEVHEKCRKTARTDFYYLIHPNTEVFDTFNFDYSFEFGLDKEKQKIVVWQKQNPITDLTREYHGVGLFPKDGPVFKEKEYEIFNFKKKAVYEKDAVCRDIKFPIIRTTDLLNLKHDVDTDMFWLVHEDVEEFDDDFYPFIYDREFIHNFNVKTSGGTIVRNGVRLVPRKANEGKQKDVEQVIGKLKKIEVVKARTLEEAVDLAENYTFWMVNPDLKLINNLVDEFYPDLYHTGPSHIWKFKSRKGKDLGYGGLAFSNKDYHSENIKLHEDEYGARIPDRHNIRKFFTRDPYKAFRQAKGRTFYWVVDTAVELLDSFDFDFYPDIYSIENVFAFKSEEDGEAGVYLVHRPHLEKFNPSEEDFSFDRFKNIIRIDEVASRTTGHPAFYFDEGFYSEKAKYFHEHPNIDVIDASKGLAKAYLKASNMTRTGYFWAVSNDVELTEDFNRTYYVDRHRKSYFHLWPKANPYTGFVHQYGGLCLIPTAALKELKPDDDKIRKMNFKNKKPVKSKTASSVDIPFDVVFLSYREKEADARYKDLLKRIPNAKRVHGVKGIFNAHKRAAEVADTKMFYVIDADAELLPDFEFEYFPTVWDEDAVHVWKSKNPINGLIYGFGGLKLFPTQLLRDAKEWKIDFTTSIAEKFKPMPVVANYTAFNTNPYETWKSAFRECTKLSSGIIHNLKADEDKERLDIWCTVAEKNAKFGKYSIAGAKAGREFGNKYGNDPEKLKQINDYDWLNNRFKQDFKNE